MKLDISENERLLLIRGLTTLAKRRADALQYLQITLPENEELSKLQFNDVGIGEIDDLARKLGGSSLGLG
jgi:hypothetical protein